MNGGKVKEVEGTENEVAVGIEDEVRMEINEWYVVLRMASESEVKWYPDRRRTLAWVMYANPHPSSSNPERNAR